MNAISTATAYLVGLDLGDRRDWTALSVLRQHAVPTGRTIRKQVGFSLDVGVVSDAVPETEYQYDTIYLDRWRGRGYKVAAPIVADLLQELRDETHRQRMASAGGTPSLEPLPVWVLADETGVGIAVVEDLRAAGLTCTGITITGGDSWSQSGNGYRVPKKDLVSTLRVLVENRRITVSDALPLGSVLESELQNFKVKTKLSTGNDSYGAGDEWREGAHDDLVLSVAMAAWVGETQNLGWFDDIVAYAASQFSGW